METTKDKVAVCTIKAIDAKIDVNTNGKRYKKVTLVTIKGKTTRGVMYEAVWDKVSVGDDANCALSTNDEGKIIPSVMGLPLESLTFDDYGVAAPVAQDIIAEDFEF